MSEETERIELSYSNDGTSDVEWSVQSAKHTERLNEPYSLVLDLETDNMDAEPVLMLGQPASMTIVRGTKMRQVTGIVSAVTEGSTHPEIVTARVVVVPALESLRHRVNTKIFQEMTVPEILEEVLGEGLGSHSRSVENRTERTYLPCDYRVQYDESDFSFCQRLMEEEGIVYWFEFEGEAETMVFADAADNGEIESLHDSLLLYSEYLGGAEAHEHITRLHNLGFLQSTGLEANVFDWQSPYVRIEGALDEISEEIAEYHGAAIPPARKVYEHDEQPLTREPGGTTYGNDLEDKLTIRRQEQAWRARIAEGQSTVSAMRVGATFEVVGHGRADLDGKYLVIEVSHSFEDFGEVYENAFDCIPDGVPFRPRRRTPKPRVESIQTAIVVGPSGEEIHTDEHGRIKVQFHWDRLGASDDTSSCWVRVMQPWAGAGWGFVFIPRIGMEVVIKFINGDPDQPVVMGSVYNGENPPPYSLPDEKTKSTIKTDSSLGGGGSNEVRFEDLAGSEEIYTHAEKDENEVVENDHTTTVGHDQTNTVENNQVQEIGVDQTERVGGNQEMEVEGNRTTHILGDFNETIDGSETRTVSSGATETIDAGETRTITGGMTEDISGGRTQTIDGDSTETITGALTQTVVGGVSITTPASYTINAAAGVTILAPAGSQIIVPGGHQLIAPAGQTVIDGNHQTTGDLFKDNFMSSFGIKSWKVDISSGIAISHTNQAMELTGFKTGVVTALMESETTLMEMGTNRLNSGGPVAKFFAGVMTYL